MDFAIHAAAGQNFGTLFGFDVADDLTGNLDLTDGYVGADDGMRSNHQAVGAGDGPCKISIDTQHATKVQFAAEVYSLVQKTRNLVRLFALTFHKCRRPISTLSHGGIQTQSIKLMDFIEAAVLFVATGQVVSST